LLNPRQWLRKGVRAGVSAPGQWPGLGVPRLASLLSVVACLLLSSVPSTRAQHFDPPAATLANLATYVQELDAAPSRAAVQPPDHPFTLAAEATDDVYLALRNYVETVLAADSSLQLAQADQPKRSDKTTATGEKPRPAGKPKKLDPAKPVKATDPEQAYYVGSQACATCHAAEVASYGDTLMGRVLLKNPRNAQERGCETCHGPGSAHVNAGGGRGVGIISFRADDPATKVEEINGICLSCHQRGDRTYWDGSVHEERALACTNCHQIMKRVSPKFQLLKGTELETCLQCHQEKRAQLFRNSHMPVREGKMTCSDCHQPHGTATEHLIREASLNDLCYKCHAEKRGPFLFEHQPVRENCDACHEPHGSINEYLLKVSRPRLCAECHGFGHGITGITGGPLAVQTMGRSCQNCHTKVHGTNSPSGALLQR
jgi:DmsE family decaheme c-type cytochrome